MPEIIFNGSAGRLEGRYHHNPDPESKLVIILHPHPEFGGTMNNPIVYHSFYKFIEKKFSVLRFNFRGVGKSQGTFDSGLGELSDAAAALDWAQARNPDSMGCWVLGFSFGSWIAMQLLMRRPEIEGFISISPPANLYDFSFLAPCPSSGLIINGSQDIVAPKTDIQKLVEKLKKQKGIEIEHKIIQGANHYFDQKIDDLIAGIEAYLDYRISLGVK
ncbi:alpha/beta hydrolase [Hyphomicrobiales bacterium]|jgi:alpha/beta superfamily hydrolase|nr:alpha/beta hydrolase [Hyphomicrobiales bacterium]